MSDLLYQLNEAQREAAACTEGPVMIIAGAGSGKTRTLTYRIAHLVEMGVDPFNILSLTFTNKAAGEMKERIVSLVGADAKNIWMGTFHSIFARILRAEATKIGYNPTFTIYDTDDTKSAIRQIIKSLNLDPKTYNVSYVLSRISMAKSSLISPEDYLSNEEIIQQDKASRRPEIGNIYLQYNKRLRNSMAMDFDDLLFNTNVLLRDNPDVLLKYQNRFKYILVDEYQDTNYSQYLIVKKLAARHQNICVVGDDAQSIYAFRGANIQNIFNFKRDYPNVQLFKLEQNYRSTQVIVKAANNVIANNLEQIKKEIWTDNGQGELIKVLRSSDEREEGARVADSILQAHLGNDLEFKSFAVLYRNNAQSRAIEDALRRNKIPYRIYSGLSFYSRKEIKDVLSYLRLVVNNHDDEALVRVINYPPRGIGQTSLDRIRLAASDNEVSIATVLENLSAFGIQLTSKVTASIEDFMTKIKLFSSEMPVTNAYDLSKRVVYSSGIINLLRSDDDPDNPNRIENIEELLNGIQEFCEKEDLITPEGEEIDSSQLKTLDMFLQQVLLLTSEDKDKDDPNKVSLMTIHAAKGLEFPHVYVVGMEENIFPSALSISSRPELEEERRLFYVAVTRAEKKLTLSYADTRYQYGSASCQELSRFVSEIDPVYLQMPETRRFPKPGNAPESRLPLKKLTVDTKKLKKIQNIQNAPAVSNSPEDISKIQSGMRVRHAKFGIGKVLSIEGSDLNDRKAVIFFEGVGEKQLMLRFAKLSIVE